MVGSTSRLTTGTSYSLGATPDGLGTNFAVFSAHAERIDLCLFNPSGRHEIERLTLPECTDEVWQPARRASGPPLRLSCLRSTSRTTAIASTSTSCCLIRMRGGSPGSCGGRMRCLAIA
jgi:hypothetical protein